MDTRQEHIRAIFLDRRESYGLREAAEIVGVSPATLKREANEDARELYKRGRLWRFAWRQVVCFAMRRWTLAEIHDALGTDAEAVLPPLLSLRAVTIRLPEYMLRALEAVAAEDGMTFDAALHGELIDFAGTMAGRIEKKVPGFRSAYFYPGRA